MNRDGCASAQLSELSLPSTGMECHFSICAFTHQKCIRHCRVVLGAVLGAGDTTGRKTNEIVALMELTGWCRKIDKLTHK